MSAATRWNRRWAKLVANWIINHRGKLMEYLGLPHSKHVGVAELRKVVSPSDFALVVLKHLSEKDRRLFLEAVMEQEER